MLLQSRAQSPPASEPETGAADWTETEVVAVEPPTRLVEHGTGAHGRRRTEGSYMLACRPDASTEVTFELRFLQLPPLERLLVPLLRRQRQRALAETMRRLRAQLTAEETGDQPARSA